MNMEDSEQHNFLATHMQSRVVISIKAGCIEIDPQERYPEL